MDAPRVIAMNIRELLGQDEDKRRWDPPERWRGIQQTIRWAEEQAAVR